MACALNEQVPKSWYDHNPWDTLYNFSLHKGPWLGLESSVFTTRPRELPLKKGTFSDPKDDSVFVYEPIGFETLL